MHVEPVGLRWREPIHRSLRELAVSYFAGDDVFVTNNAVRLHAATWYEKAQPHLKEMVKMKADRRLEIVHGNENAMRHQVCSVLPCNSSFAASRRSASEIPVDVLTVTSKADIVSSPAAIVTLRFHTACL